MINMTSCVQTYHFQCQRRPSRRGLVPELSPNPAVPARRRNPKPQIGQKWQAHTPEMTAANFHRPPTRTADAAQHRRHESEEDITRPLPRDHTGRPTPASIGLEPANRVFFSKCRRTNSLFGMIKIDKNSPGKPKGRRKKNLTMCDHMAQPVPKTPPKQHDTKKEPSWDRKTSSPFDMWRQPKQKSLWYRAIWMSVAPNDGAERCPLKPKLDFNCFEICCLGSWSTEFPYMATLTLPRGCPQVSPWFQKGSAGVFFPKRRRPPY